MPLRIKNAHDGEPNMIPPTQLCQVNLPRREGQARKTSCLNFVIGCREEKNLT